MLTEEDAHRFVLAELDNTRDSVDCELGILRVQAVPFGWVFYWGGVGLLPNGQEPRLAGNGPFLVDRENERLIRTGTSLPVRRQIADYERRLRHEAHARHAAVKRTARGEGG
jgi:hypothetical protein